MAKEPLKGVIVGAGNRSRLYAAYARKHPKDLQIVGVVDPDRSRCEAIRDLYGFPEEHLFRSVKELVRGPKIGDLVINGTMDRQHVETSLPTLKAGYHLLLEKPIAVSEEELWELVRAAEAFDRKVCICHVLRHAPFYAAIREQVAAGVLGELMNIQAVEHVSYHHLASAFIRGKWGNEKRSGSTFLLQKCCHDLDLIAWMNSGVPLKRVSSFGNRQYFREEQAPQGSGERCLVDCAIEPECPYSAGRLYLGEDRLWSYYAWNEFRDEAPTQSMEAKREQLKGDHPFGRCVWRCDNDIVDHQSVAIEFANGSTATLNMVGGTAKPSRSLHLLGTLGELQGVFEEGTFVIRKPDLNQPDKYAETWFDVNIHEDTTGLSGGHGGGDLRLVEDFLKVVRGEAPSLSTTALEDSITGHLMVFKAEEARINHVVVEL